MDLLYGERGDKCTDCRKMLADRGHIDHARDCDRRRGCGCRGMCGETGVATSRCAFQLPELDPFSEGVLLVFKACQTQWQWDTGFGFTRRVGVPVDRFVQRARLMGYEPGELFAEKFDVCVRRIVNYDVSNLPKSDEI